MHSVASGRRTGVWLWALVVLASSALGPRPAVAAGEFSGLYVGSDTTVTLGAQTLAIDQIGLDDLMGVVSLTTDLALPDGVAIIGYDRQGSAELFAFDTSVVLGSLTVRPGDVVRRESGVFTLAFDAGAAGIPVGIAVDAIASRDGDLEVSFDATLTLGGLTIAPEDLVRIDVPTPVLRFDGSAAGVPAGANLDAATVLPSGNLLLSFDVSGHLAAFDFNDEDVLQYNPSDGLWQLAYQPSTHFPGWAAADLSVLAALAPSPTATPTVTASSTATATHSPTPTATQTSTPTHTATATSTLAPSGTATSPPTSTPEPSRTPIPSATETIAPTRTPIPSATTTPNPSATSVPTATATPTSTATATANPSATATGSMPPTPTHANTATATAVPSASSTPNPTATRSPSPTPSATLAPTATGTIVPSASPSATASPSVTAPGATATPTVAPSPTATAPPPIDCVGDCNDNGVVTIDEIIRGVTIALDPPTLSRCRALDRNGSGTITISELVQATSNALHGCR